MFYDINNDLQKLTIYEAVMDDIMMAYKMLLDKGVSKEDAAMVLPLGMTTKVVDKRNLRNLVDMSRQRMCSRAYLEYRLLFEKVCKALSEYSEEWNTLVKMCFHAKCDELGYCPENKSCGRMPKRTK